VPIEEKENLELTINAHGQQFCFKEFRAILLKGIQSYASHTKSTLKGKKDLCNNGEK
jgi:hypothetical protein